ncbi:MULTISPECIES: hypothetical protein [Methylomonas]|uniref:Uncharacterized protein n=2 Tax=Methylomonas TaxID=416 RepID=A0A140E6R4_9GAMM|nr:MULTISPECIES: hypothetical protein [Methylomonas]AMK79088.1 hypothetical protein JT25_021830 [Methylomonas denitrificans]OAH99593.1 hypothetical protein A1342_07665 [Methylomonas methanica]TCV78200.1 hypothetical protein EDE11_12547 [Methylomonas methanica]
MEKTYLWLVHDYKSHPIQLSEAAVVESRLPVQCVDLNSRYHLFVVYRKDLDGFWYKIKRMFPCQFKVYEFSEDELLVGEHYVDPLTNVIAFMPWIADKTLCPSKSVKYRFFFFADFNATFAVTGGLLEEYLNKLPCQFDVLGCVKNEPAFYTGDSYYDSKLKVQMQYADVLLVMGLLFKMVVENHRVEDEGSMTILYGRFGEGQVRVFDRWCVPNIWTLSHDASFGHEMPLFCQWEFEQAIRKATPT